MEKNDRKITRKEFLKKSSAGITGLVALNVLKKSPLRLWGNSDSGLVKRVLGRSGIEPTVLGYGASRSMEPSLLMEALGSGINFIDTGLSYFNGNNQRMIGETLQELRKDVIIQSKIRVRLRGSDSSEYTPGAIRKSMESDLQACLKALSTDYIDIMLIHDPGEVDVLTNETVMEFFAAAKKQGVIRAHGFSCHDEIPLLEIANESRFFDIIMLPYNHKGSYVHMNSGRSSEWDQPRVEVELKKAHKNNLGIVAMKTCSAGPYVFKNSQAPSFQGALEWVLDHDFISAIAVAMSNRDEIQENLRAARLG
ncbi:MAG: aldo/keto reductase [Candidatus Aminicenantaceae bacterium]